MLALAGGYLIAAAYIRLLAAGLSKLGLNPGEAAYFGLMSGLVLYVVYALWVAATRFLARMVGGTVVAVLSLNVLSSTLASSGI